VADIDAILAVEGLDAVIIGPNDLSASIGLLGNPTHAEVLKLCATVIARCKALGKPCGVSIGPGDQQVISMWLATGVDFISCGDDISFLAMGARSTLASIRNN
jgi:2-keto-3-deoxy-L-rhamnonate aldolase RhmA